jgi:hypothetical protein
MHLLIRLVFPVIWKIDPRLWTSWTEMGQIAILGGGSSGHAQSQTIYEIEDHATV